MVIFEEGFESNDFSAWDGTMATPTIVEDPVYQGDYAMKCDATHEGVYKLPTGVADGFLRFYIRRSTTPTQDMNIGEIWDSGYSTGVVAFINTSNVLYLTAPSGDYSSGETLAVDTWYCVEIERKVGDGDGYAKLWLNGVLKVEKTTETISGNLFEIDVGTLSYSGVLTAYFDSVVLGDARVYCESEGQQILTLRTMMEY